MCIYIYIYIYIYKYIYTHISVCVRACVARPRQQNVCVCMYIYYIHMYVCVYIHTCTHGYKYVCVYIYTYTYSHKRVQLLTPPPLARNSATPTTICTGDRLCVRGYSMGTGKAATLLSVLCILHAHTASCFVQTSAVFSPPQPHTRVGLRCVGASMSTPEATYADLATIPTLAAGFLVTRGGEEGLPHVMLRRNQKDLYNNEARSHLLQFSPIPQQDQFAAQVLCLCVPS